MDGRSGLAMACDDEGRIVSVVHDGIGLLAGAVGTLFPALFNERSIPAALDFLLGIRERGAALDQPLGLRPERGGQTLPFSGMRAGGLLAVTASLAGAEAESFFGNISALNNELINSQRELSRSNASLRQLSAEKASLVERLEKTVAEKDLILHEAHHRIKNNMASIGSFLTLKRDLSGNPEVGTILTECIAQLSGMGILYQKLYRSAETASVSVAEYLPAILEEALGLFDKQDEVALRFDLPETALPGKSLSTLGIIFNELLTNSIKYAFAETPDPRIEVDGERRNGVLVLRYRDNGKGLPESFSLDSATGFGTTVIAGMAYQLGGSVSARNDGGACFEIELPDRTD